MKNILLVCSLLVTFFTLAQPSSVVKAEASFASGNYYEASELLVKAYDRVSPRNARALKLKSRLAYETGYAFERIFNNDKAKEWYQRAIDLKYYEQNETVYFRLGNLFRESGDYSKAKENYVAYLELVPTDQQAKNAIASLKRATMMKDNRTRYVVKDETKISSNGFDMAPAIASRRGNAIVFGSTRPAPIGTGTDPTSGEGFFNLWEVEKDRNGNWQKPVLFEAEGVNTENNEGTLAFDGRFRNVFFTRCPRIEKKNIGCQIWTAEKKGRSFSEPVQIKLAPRDSISVGHPLPNEDGNVLIFSSDLAGGFGGKDLWYSKYDRREKTWTKPVNLGATINTPGNELFPTYALNGDLLFASTGHGGLGGLDIYRAPKTAKEMEFGKPENVGAPINSISNDYSLVELNEKEGFFTSNRDGVNGNSGLPDIWSYKLPPNVFDLKIIVSQVGADQPIEGATVKVTPDGGQAFTGTTNSDGIVFWDKKPDGNRFINENTDYTILIEPLEGFHPSKKTEDFSTKGLKYDQNFIFEMGLLPKTPIVLPEVRYDLGSAKLQVNDSVNSKDSLNFVYKLLQEYPGMVLKLISHTDSRGSSGLNAKLSKERSQSCINYLVKEKGVDPKRLVAEGEGEGSPRIIFLKDGKYFVDKPEGDFKAIKLATDYINQFKGKNKTLFDKLHQFNRRTEAEVIRMDFNTVEKSTEE